MKTPRVTLDQWRTLQAVVDQGGYAQAAETLHRSQSTVSYAIRRLEEQLGMEILIVRGRKAELTEAGKMILQRARTLVEDAGELEQLAADVGSGREAEIRLVVDASFPFTILIQALRQFRRECGQTRIQLEQVVLSGADEKLAAGEADLAISHRVPNDLLGDDVMQIEFVAVAHPDHALHRLEGPLTIDQLRDQMQIIISDSGKEHKRNLGWLGAEHQWRVSSIEASLQLIRNGMGYGWLPRHMICEPLAKGELGILPLREGKIYNATLYLVYGNRHHIGPATAQLAKVLVQRIQEHVYSG